MRSHSEARIVSTKRYRSASVQFLSLIVLFAVCGRGTRAVLLAQGKTKLEMKPRVSLGVVIDASAHQKKVIEFEREVVNSLADGFAGLATESFVVRYADEVEILQGWSPLDTGLKTVSRRIELDAHSAKNGRTFLYDAVNVGLLEFDTGNSANSKVLIIIGEGNDAGSLARYSQIKKRAKSDARRCRGTGIQRRGFRPCDG